MLDNLVILLALLWGPGVEAFLARALLVLLLAALAVVATATATWVVLETRGRRAWLVETERVVAAPDGPYRAAELVLPRTRAPVRVRVAAWIALAGTSATVPWLGIGVTELAGAGNPIVLTTALALVGAGAWAACAGAAALARRTTHESAFAFAFGTAASAAASAAVLAVAASAAVGAFDGARVEVCGIKGYRSIEPLGSVLRSHGIFSSCGGHAGLVWEAMIVVALASGVCVLGAHAALLAARPGGASRRAC